MTGAVLLVGAALLIVAGLGGLTIAARIEPRATVLAVGGNRPVDPAAVDPLMVTAQNSPTLGANPTDAANLAVVNRVDIPRFGCQLRVSFDAGATWRPTPIPASGPCFAPDAAFDASGRLHVAFTVLAPEPPGTSNPASLWVASSGDGGRTLTPPVRVSGPRGFQARLAADPTGPGRLHLTWVQAGETRSFGFATVGNPVVGSHSDDGGATWSAPVRVSPAIRSRVVGPVPAVVGDSVWLAYLDVGDDRLDYGGAHEGRGGEPHPGPWSLVVARSGDGGRTWTETVVDDELVPTRRFIQLFAPVPSLAVDGERVYVAVADGRRGDADVWLWRSPDGGARWEAPVRVNDTPIGDGRTQELPALDVAADGRLDVVYYDRQADPADVLAQVSLQSSLDGARTFTPAVTVSDRPSDSRLGLGADRGLPELGTRLAVLSRHAGAIALWADTRNGSPAIAKQLLAQSMVSITTSARRAQRLLQGASAVAFVVAIALLAVAVRPGAGSADVATDRGGTPWLCWSSPWPA